jgi:hypothetical protein
MLSMKSVIQIAVLLLILCLPFIAAAQPPPPKPTGTSIISGRVIYADTARPVRRAKVMLFSDINRSPIRTTPANFRGEFRFNQVLAGSYLVVAEGPGIISPMSSFSITELGVGTNEESEYTRVTVDGNNAIRCEVRAVRSGTIKGTITYDDKEPVVRARIVVFRRKDGVVAPFFLEPVTTNDRGMYRIDGLPDGEYFVGLVNGEAAATANTERTEAFGVPNAFYPGVRSLADAKPVQVEAAAEVTNVDMTLNEDVLRQISGTVKWKGTDEPIMEGAVTLRRKDDPAAALTFMDVTRMESSEEEHDENLFTLLPMLLMTLPTTARVDDKGEWVFKDLPPGTYIVTAATQLRDRPDPSEKKEERDPALPPPLEEERRFVTRQVEVKLEEEDLKDIKIELSEGGRILGAVAGDGPVPGVAITINQKGVDSFVLNMPQASDTNGTFMIDGVPAGEILIDVDIPRRMDFYLTSITLGSQDLMREPLRMEEGAQVSGVRVTLATGLATLSGRAQLGEGGKPVAGAGVLLVPADQALWHMKSLRCFASADSNGEFKLQCPPRDYLLFTWAPQNKPIQNLDAYVRAQAANARRITLQSKEEKQLELTITTKRP